MDKKKKSWFKKVTGAFSKNKNNQSYAGGQDEDYNIEHFQLSENKIHYLRAYKEIPFDRIDQLSTDELQTLAKNYEDKYAIKLQVNGDGQRLSLAKHNWRQKSSADYLGEDKYVFALMQKYPNLDKEERLFVLEQYSTYFRRLF